MCPPAFRHILPEARLLGLASSNISHDVCTLSDAPLSSQNVVHQFLPDCQVSDIGFRRFLHRIPSSRFLAGNFVSCFSDGNVVALDLSPGDKCLYKNVTICITRIPISSLFDSSPNILTHVESDESAGKNPKAFFAFLGQPQSVQQQMHVLQQLQPTTWPSWQKFASNFRFLASSVAEVIESRGFLFQDHRLKVHLGHWNSKWCQSIDACNVISIDLQTGMFILSRNSNKWRTYAKGLGKSVFLIFDQDPDPTVDIADECEDPVHLPKYISSADGDSSVTKIDPDPDGSPDVGCPGLSRTALAAKVKLYSLPDFQEQIKIAAQQVVKTHDRVGRVCTCSSETVQTCAQSNHQGKNCEVCFIADLKSRAHRRTRTVHIGVVALDLISLGQEKCGILIASQVVDGDHRVSLAYPVVDRSNGEVSAAISSALLDFQYLYGLPGPTRINTDREPAIYEDRKSWSQKFLKIAFTEGNCPQSNGLSERVNGIICASARRSLQMFSCPVTRAKLWPYAIQHACFIANVPVANTRICRMRDQTIPPFATLSIVKDRGENADNLGLSKLDPRGSYGLYLGPDPEIIYGSRIALLQSDTALTDKPLISKILSVSQTHPCVLPGWPESAQFHFFGLRVHTHRRRTQGDKFTRVLLCYM